MIMQRAPGRAPVVQASPRPCRFRDASFAATLAILTVITGPTVPAASPSSGAWPASAWSS
jgi:hypothetical protein